MTRTWIRFRFPQSLTSGFFGLLVAALASSVCSAGDWVTAPSYFTHDPQTGQRVHQYSQIGPFYIHGQRDFRRSGYRQTRSSIQAGGSSDHMHVVEEWGGEVRPYGEWRFPYRPNSVPYDLWGPMFPGLGGRGGFARGFYGPGARGGWATPPGGGAPTPPGPPVAAPNPPFRAYPGYAPQPHHDGRYPPYDADGPYGYPDLLQRPATPFTPAGSGP